MNCKSLLKILSSLSEDELNLPVAIYADHGQQAFKARVAEMDYVSREDGELLTEEESQVTPSDLMFVISD